MKEDEQYLKIISIFHYIVGGLAGLFACFPILHFAVGIGMLISSFVQPQEGGLPFMLMGLFFTFLAGSIMLIGWAFAICIIITGRYIAQRRNHLFCLVVAGVQCMFTPFGTVLGVFTLIILLRPSVKELFVDQPAGLKENVA
jgi:hypothetical protein